MYGEQLSQLGGMGSVHRTRLKEELLIQFPDMNVYEEGRDVLLMFDCDVGPAVVKAVHTDWHQDALCCLLYTSPSPRDGLLSRMPSSA